MMTQVHTATRPPTPVRTFSTILKPGPLQPISLATVLGPMSCAGEQTTAPGLVITPGTLTFPGEGFTGLFVVTHRTSGRMVSWQLPLIYARDAAAFLADTGVDWTRSSIALGADPAAGEARAYLERELFRAEREKRPLRWARTSWVTTPPRWRIHHAGVPTELSFETWLHAVAAADVVRWGRHTLHDDDTVVRDQAPAWDLRCAAPSCTPAPDTISGELDSDFDDYPPTRSALARLARDTGWIRHGRYWLCRDCAIAYASAAR